MIPSLFNNITVEYGKEIKVERNITKEKIEILKKELENSLNNMTWDLDKKYARNKIKPGKTKKKNDQNI